MHAISSGRSVKWLLPLLFLMAGPIGVSAQLEIYFNRSVDTSLAWPAGNVARGGRDFSIITLEELNTAKSSIDMAMYSLNTPRVVNALIAARARGVKVRVIAHVENLSDSSNRFGDLAQAGIPIITNPKAAQGEIQPLMHDKFFVIDARSTAPPDAHPVVITGSWNATQQQTYLDANNLVIVRDSAVAHAYLVEFEEMWGSGADIPDTAAARFGRAKQSTTRHFFTLANGSRLELRFSPTDSTSRAINNHLAACGSSILTANLTFTYALFARTLRDRAAGGANVRSIIDNIDDAGSQYGFIGTFAEAYDWQLDGLLHHKYAVLDALPFGHGSAAAVITGSHNWTSSAETRNDENMIAIVDSLAANQYLQEFAARYRDVGGTTPFVGISGVSDGDRRNASGAAAGLRAYPNPFTSTVTLVPGTPGTGELVIADNLGQVVLVTNVADGAHTVEWNAAAYPAGIYHVVLRHDGRTEHLKLTIVR
ncbi:MAG: T9SS type A sorting domain-containing protein [Bacteroidetes bacterium]|nr:T9SS type A sorting domain-containing protein [Bacteroidota bacterium]